MTCGGGVERAYVRLLHSGMKLLNESDVLPCEKVDVREAQRDCGVAVPPVQLASKLVPNVDI